MKQYLDFLRLVRDTGVLIKLTGLVLELKVFLVIKCDLI